MQRPMVVSRRFQIGLFGGLMVIEAVVLPLLFLATGNTQIWLSLFLASTAWLVFVAIPWILVAPVRRLRREQVAAHPHALVSIITTWDGDGATVELGLLIADRESIVLRPARADTQAVIPWALVETVAVVQSGHPPGEQVELATTGLSGTIRFLPLRANGLQSLEDWRLAEFVTSLRNARTGRVSAH